MIQMTEDLLLGTRETRKKRVNNSFELLKESTVRIFCSVKKNPSGEVKYRYFQMKEDSENVFITSRCAQKELPKEVLQTRQKWHEEKGGTWGNTGRKTDTELPR